LRQSGPYHLFITLSPSFSSALIGIGVGSPVRVGYRAEGRAVLFTHHFRQEKGIHRVQAYGQLLAHLEANVRQRRQSACLRFAERALANKAVPSVVFPFTEAEQQIAVLPPSPQVTTIVFNVNSEAQSRRLPLSTWITLGQRLLSDSEHQTRIVFIGTLNEQPRVAEVIKGIGQSDRLLDFSGKTTLRGLAILLRDADVVVTNDSGPMHLANAVGTPVVTFFGAGDPAVTRPFNADRTILLNAHVACSPCVKNVCRFPRVACLENIVADEIYQSILKLLS
jgi:ADP-heptose:LPS heptosyltransferase